MYNLAMVRTRIAPSPTGLPHIGTIYQALFDYAFAKKNSGHFVVRIEDTDRTRFIEGAEEKIYQALDWFALTEDESPRKDGKYGPYKQSERLNLYKKYAEELVLKGHAYYCFCSKERLDEVRKKMQAEKKVPKYDKYCLLHEDCNQKRELYKGDKPYVIRLKVPEHEQIIVKDGIRGDIVFASNDIDDQVLLKSDGFPTYHLAVVVDDHLMAITHAVRGEEWLPSAPKHCLLYKFLGWEAPLYFHTPVIRNPDKSKLSKRHGHTSVEWYQSQGYLPQAILNYLALLGWTNPTGKEIFSLEEFIREFELRDLRAIGPVFDITKLDWMNGEYIRKTQDSKLKAQIHEFYKNELDEKIIGKTIPLIKERIKKLSDYYQLCEFFFMKPKRYEVDLSSKKEMIKKITETVSKITDWKANIIGEKMLELARNLGVKNSEFFMVLRVVISGKKITPPLNESMEILGKGECLTRLKSASD